MEVKLNFRPWSRLLSGLLSNLIILGTTGNVAEDDANEDLTQSELFEEKLRETIDLATQKSANGKPTYAFYSWALLQKTVELKIS